MYQSLTVVNPGYSVHQVREEMSQLMNEAERRHHIATRYQNEASEMRLGILEQQAERRHLEVVAKLERNISSIEVRAADRGKYLVAELQSLQEQNMAMQRDHAANISIAEAIQAHRLQVTYTNEMAEFARTNQEFLSEEFAQNLTIFRKEEAFRFARTEDEMRAQNDELQEQLLSAECALRFFGNEALPKTFRCQALLSEGSGYTDTGVRTPPLVQLKPCEGCFHRWTQVQQPLNQKEHPVSPRLQVRLGQLLAPRPLRLLKLRWLPIRP